MARQLLRTYLDLNDLVQTGRDILAILNGPSASISANHLLSMMRSQLALAERLIDRLSNGAMAELLELHIMDQHRLLTGQIKMKWVDSANSYEFLIDQWLWSEDILEQYRHYGTIKGASRIDSIYFLPATGNRNDPRLTIHVSPEALVKAGQLLDTLEASAKELKAFIIEKFKFEDVM